MHNKFILLYYEAGVTYKWKSLCDKLWHIVFSAHPEIEGNKQENSRPAKMILNNATCNNGLRLYLSISLSQSVSGPYTLAVARALESGTRSKASRQWSIYYVCGMYLLSAIPRRAVCTRRTFTLEPTVAGEPASESYGWIRKMRRKQLQPAPAVTLRSTFASRMQIWLFWWERAVENAKAQTLMKICERGRNAPLAKWLVFQRNLILQSRVEGLVVSAVVHITEALFFIIQQHLNSWLAQEFPLHAQSLAYRMAEEEKNCIESCSCVSFHFNCFSL